MKPMQTRCANCEILVRWKPTIVDGVAYCCEGCATGGPCECDYAHLPALEPLIRFIRFEIKGYRDNGDSDNSLTSVQRESNARNLI
jgi:hypothetical protein